MRVRRKAKKLEQHLSNAKTPLARATSYAMGLSTTDIEQPFIGVVTSWSELSPSHIGLAQQAQVAKRGIRANNSTPREFTATALSDEILLSGNIAKSSLINREIIADTIELTALSHKFDALIGFAGCDISLAAMVMSMARINIPSIVMFGGSMIAGTSSKSDITILEFYKAIGEQFAGIISYKEFHEIEAHCLPSAGSITAQYSANNMACVIEALGLTLPNASFVPTIDLARDEIAYQSGIAITDLMKSNLKPRDILTRKAFENAITVLTALGGSTSTILHIVAIAYECGINFEQSDITDICRKIPHIADLKPAGTYSIHEFQQIGGVLVVMNLLLQNGFIHPDCKTITGKTIAENLAEIAVPASQNIIQFPENPNLYTPRPYTRTLSGLTGNFAPEGGLVYRSNSEILEFKGPLRCFDSEEAAIEAITKHIYVNGDVILIRYEGPVGGPGMREMYIPQLLLQAQGTLDNVALITDGRFSNLGSGFCISHIGPEAALGGPIGLVKDGDMISITIKEDIISVNLSNEELEARRGLWKPREPLFLSAVASKYKKLVSSANKGAVTHEGCNLNKSQDDW